MPSMKTLSHYNFSYAGRSVITVSKLPLTVEDGCSMIACSGDFCLTVAITAAGCPPPQVFVLDASRGESVMFAANHLAVRFFMEEFTTAFLAAVKPSAISSGMWEQILSRLADSLEAAGVNTPELKRFAPGVRRLL